MRVTDPISKQLAELQLTLGKGPSQDGSASGGPVLASDLGAAEAGRRWPAFAPAARQAGAGAIFAFPLRIGAAIRVGVLGLYRAWPGPARPAHSSWLTRWSSPTPRPCWCPAARMTRRGASSAGIVPGGQPADLALHRAERGWTDNCCRRRSSS
jgi:hypothetical protein